MPTVSLINGHIDEQKKETNYERVKKMDIEQLAELLYVAADKICFENCTKETGNKYNCTHGEAVNPELCKNCIKAWLKSEV